MIPGRIVVDASFALPWVFSDERDAAAEAAWEALKNQRTEALVPALWLWEMSNVLVLSEKHGRVTRADVRAFFGLLRRLPIRVQTRIHGFGVGGGSSADAEARVDWL